MHSGLLIHDDIIDDDLLRRGHKTIFAQYSDIASKSKINNALSFLPSAMFTMQGKQTEIIAGGNFKYILGEIGYFFLPTLLVLLGTSYLKSETPNVGWRSGISGVMFLLSSLGILNILGHNNSGGILGEILSTPLVSLFVIYASIVFLGAILIIFIGRRWI